MSELGCADLPGAAPSAPQPLSQKLGQGVRALLSLLPLLWQELPRKRLLELLSFPLTELSKWSELLKIEHYLPTLPAKDSVAPSDL